MSDGSLRILSLADDLTGLAEVAGSVANLGLEGTLYPNSKKIPEEPDCKTMGKVCFVNLACRGLSGPNAQSVLSGFLGEIDLEKLDHVYLKVDSAARGPIGPLMKTLMESVQAQSLPLLLANPGQKRSIRKGKVLLNEVPLSRTDFRNDPIHPRWTSFLPDLLVEETLLDVEILNSSAESGSSGVHVLDASSKEEIEDWANTYSDSKVACGAAPFGVALILKWAASLIQSRPMFVPFPFEKTLAVVGTRHPAGDRLADQFRSYGGEVVSMGEDWSDKSLPLLIHTQPEIGHPTQILEELTTTAIQMVDALAPETIFAVGGESAQSLVEGLGFTSLTSKGQQKAVSILESQNDRGSKMNFLLKPGSYEEPDLLEQLFMRNPSRDPQPQEIKI